MDSLPAEPWGKPKNIGVGSPSLLQWIFLTQELNWGFLHCRWIPYQLSYWQRIRELRSPTKSKQTNKPVLVGFKCFPDGARGKELICQCRRHNVRRFPGIGNGNPLQYSCLDNPMDSGAWRVTVHRVAKSQTQLKQRSTHAGWASVVVCTHSETGSAGVKHQEEWTRICLLPPSPSLKS